MSPIRATDIDRFVREEGEQVLHYVGMRCWCSAKNGQLDPNCKAHDITGSIYADPVSMTGLFCDIMQRKELAATGLFLPGDAVFSPPTTSVVSEGDKIVLLAPLPFGRGDALVRGSGDTDRLFYAATSAMYCADEYGNRYYEKTDFQLSGKNIIWNWTGKTSSAVLGAGVRYAFKYKALIEWIAFIPPVERFSHGNSLGEKVMLRKLHLFTAN